jgi:hypothetical protein
MAGRCAGQTPSQAGGAGDRPAALSPARPHAQNAACEFTTDQLAELAGRHAGPGGVGSAFMGLLTLHHLRPLSCFRGH